MPKRGKAAQNAARNQLNIEVKRTCVDVTLAVWLIGLASEKYLSTAITEMNVAEEMERKIVKNPWNWQNPSPNCHDCCERVTIENGITKTVIKNCVNDRPTRNKLLTVRIHVLGSTRHRIAVLVRAANTSRTDSKTTATILIFWTSTTVSMLLFFLLSFVNVLYLVRFTSYFCRFFTSYADIHHNLRVELITLSSNILKNSIKCTAWAPVALNVPYMLFTLKPVREELFSDHLLSLCLIILFVCSFPFKLNAVCACGSIFFQRYIRILCFTKM